MAFTIYAKMKRVGKQKKEDLLPVPFELEKRPDGKSGRECAPVLRGRDLPHICRRRGADRTGRAGSMGERGRR